MECKIDLIEMKLVTGRAAWGGKKQMKCKGAMVIKNVNYKEIIGVTEKKVKYVNQTVIFLKCK